MESSFSPLDAEQGVYVGPPALSPSDFFRPFDVWDPVDPVEPVSTLSADVSTGGLIETADFYSPTRDPTLDSCIDGDMFSWIPTDEIPPPPIAYQQLGTSPLTQFPYCVGDQQMSTHLLTTPPFEFSLASTPPRGNTTGTFSCAGNQHITGDLFPSPLLPAAPTPWSGTTDPFSLFPYTVGNQEITANLPTPLPPVFSTSLWDTTCAFHPASNQEITPPSLPALLLGDYQLPVASSPSQAGPSILPPSRGDCQVASTSYYSTSSPQAGPSVQPILPLSQGDYQVPSPSYYATSSQAGLSVLHETVLPLSWGDYQVPSPSYYLASSPKAGPSQKVPFQVGKDKSSKVSSRQSRDVGRKKSAKTAKHAVNVVTGLGRIAPAPVHQTAVTHKSREVLAMPTNQGNNQPLPPSTAAASTRPPGHTFRNWVQMKVPPVDTRFLDEAVFELPSEPTPELTTVSLVVGARPAQGHGEVVRATENGRRLAAQYLCEGPPMANEDETAKRSKPRHGTLSWKMKRPKKSK